MIKSHPDVLYKYRMHNNYLLEVFEGKLYFPTLKEVNDGFETFYQYQNSKYYLIQNDLKLLSPDERTAHIAPNIEHIRATTGIYCLSARNDLLAMWALYADGHKGLCMGFEWETLKNVEPWNFPEKMEYQDQPVIIDAEPAGVSWSKTFTTKNKDFAFEQEYRLQSTPGHTPEEKKHIVKNSIKEIIFGFNAPISFINLIIEKCNKENINAKFFITKPIIGKYALSVIPHSL